MRNFLILYLFIFLFCSSLQSAVEEQGIRVTLTTETSLTPIYLTTSSQKSSFTRSYIEDLKKVLFFDFTYNGETQLLSADAEKDHILDQSDMQKAFPQAFWKSQGVRYVILAKFLEKTLSATLYSVHDDKIKFFPDISLSGSLDKDRRQIHKFADGIHKTLFQKEGIASHKILYSFQKPAKGTTWISEIYECDWDGANTRQITKENSYCITPVILSSFGDQFLYVSYKSGQPKIFLSSLLKGEGKRVIHLRGNQILPAISPQKDWIAFICDATGRADLFVQPFDPSKGAIEKPIQLFSYPKSVQASPTFSPDGKKIAFVSDKDGSPRIYLIPVTINGKRPLPTLLTKINRENACPSWSPDGKKIAYSAKTNGERQIWIYDFDKGTETQLTSGPGNKENPQWAPNSMHIVFNSVDGEISDLYIVNLHQAKPIRITGGEGKSHYPSWGRK